MDTIERHPGGGMTFAGPRAVDVFRALAIAGALRFYAKTGMKVNRAYTPSQMMQAATKLTGKTFKARDYNGAADALKAWADVTAKKIHEDAQNDPGIGETT